MSICQVCGIEFAREKHGKGAYCSEVCRDIGMQRKAVVRVRRYRERVRKRNKMGQSEYFDILCHNSRYDSHSKEILIKLIESKAWTEGAMRYRLKCKECSHEFEVVCKFEERGDIKCKKCQGKTENMIGKPRMTVVKNEFDHRKRRSSIVRF